MNAATLANLGRKVANAQGQTVEIDVDSDLYTGKTFDKVIYGTPKFKGLRATFAVHETDGLTRMIVHPDDVTLAHEAIAAL